jgi:hypothetical protein
MWFVHIVVGLILVHKDREALIMTRRGIQLQHLLKGSFLSQPALWMEYAFLTNNLNLFMRANSFNASGYHITLIWDPAKRRYMPETGPAAKIKIEKGKEYAIARDWYLKLVGERRRNDNSFWDKEDAGYYWNQLPEEIRREAIANYHKIRSLFGSE